MPCFETLQQLFNEVRRRSGLRRAIIRSPAAFRRELVLNRDDDGSLASCLLPWQVANFQALDPAWRDIAERRGGDRKTVPYRRAYIERARGHSKTSDMAVQIAWILLAARQVVTGVAAAADRDQARLIHRAVQRLAMANPMLCRDLQFIENLVRNRKTTSHLQVISSNVPGSWGMLPDFVICDELCHWRSPHLWQSLLSSAAKKPDCLLAVLTNAGIGRGWQWEVREHARLSPAWYFSSLEGPVAPWITDEHLEEQKSLLPPPVFERLWLNQWQHSDGEFVTLAEAEACRDQNLKRRDRGESRTKYLAAIDYAEKHDLTVGCLCHDDGSRIVVDRMDVVRPSPAKPTPVHWVEAWIKEIAAGFPRTTFVLDPHQLVGTIQRLEQRYDIRRFEFSAGVGNHRLALHLRQLIIHRRVAWYPGCGATDAHNFQRDDLETELASLLLRESGVGRLRIDHVRDGLHHDDRSFTLGAACVHLSELTGSDDDLFVVTPPSRDGFAW